MKKIRLFLAVPLLIILTLSSCTKENNEEQNQKEVLNQINSEVDKIANEVKS
jgi:hypothetical protein